MRFKNINRYDRRTDNRLCPYVNRGDVVRQSNETALHTLEFTFDPIFLIDMTAIGTCLGGILGIDKYNGDARQFGFIFNELSELIKSPRIMSATLILSNRCLSDIAQIFESNRPFSVFGFSHNILGDNMIDILPETTFLSREFFEMSLCRSTTAGLQTCPQLRHFSPNSFNFFTTIKLPIAIDSEVDNTHVDTECFSRFDFIGFINFNDNAEVEYAFDEYEVYLSSDSIHSGFVIITDCNGYPFSAFECQDRHRIESFPSEDTLIVSDSPMRFESRSNSFINFVCFADFCDGTNSQLRRKSELFSNVIIAELLYSDFTGSFVIKSDCRYEITCFVESFHNFFESNEVLFSSIEFDFECQFHDNRYINNSINSLRSSIYLSAKGGGLF